MGWMRHTAEFCLSWPYGWPLTCCVSCAALVALIARLFP